MSIWESDFREFNSGVTRGGCTNPGAGHTFTPKPDPTVYPKSEAQIAILQSGINIAMNGGMSLIEHIITPHPVVHVDPSNPNPNKLA